MDLETENIVQDDPGSGQFYLNKHVFRFNKTKTCFNMALLH